MPPAHWKYFPKVNCTQADQAPRVQAPISAQWDRWVSRWRHSPLAANKHQQAHAEEEPAATDAAHAHSSLQRDASTALGPQLRRALLLRPPLYLHSADTHFLHSQQQKAVASLMIPKRSML